ncbi:MAG: pentapeptide repeat-containing protein, partial [Pseudomonadota bacterium]
MKRRTAASAFALPPICGLALSSALFIGPAQAGCSSTAAAGVDWSGCRKIAKYLQDKDLSGGNFERTNLSRTNMKNAKLMKARLKRADISKTILRQADLSGADLEKAVGMRAYMDGAKLKSANLTKIELYRAQLKA